MPIRKTIRDDEYQNQITNGNNADDIGSGTSSFLLSANGSFFSRRVAVDVSCYMRLPSGTYSIYSDSGEAAVQGAIDINVGIKKGDLVIVVCNLAIGGAFQIIDIIDTITEDKITFLSNNNTYNQLDPSFPLYIVKRMDSLNDNEYKSAIITDGLVDNESSFKSANLTTSEEQSWFVADFNYDINADKLGNSNSWIFRVGNYTRYDVSGGSLSPLLVDISKDSNITTMEAVDSGTRQYIINCIKVPVNLYKEEYRSNFSDNIPIEELKGNKSLKHVMKLQLRTTFGDENGAAEVELDSEKGSVGDFGETINGFPPQFEVTNVIIQDLLGNNIDSLDSAGCNVTIDVDKVSGSLLVPTNILLTHMQLSDEDSYLNTDRYWDENLRLDQEGGVVGDTDTPNKTIESFTISNPFGSTIRIQALIRPNAGSPSEDLEANVDKQYKLFVTVGDNTRPNEECGIISLPVTSGNYQTNTDIYGLVEVDSVQYLSLDNNYYTDYAGGNGDPTTTKVVFRTETTQNAEIVGVNMEYVAYNKLTMLTESVIKTYPISFNSEIIDGKQQININQARGFNSHNELFNVFRFQNTTYSAPWQTYELEYSSLVPFRENVQVTGLSEELKTLLYDKTKLNNGLNEQSHRYSNLTDYDIKCRLLLTMRVGEIDTLYELLPNGSFRVYDYHTQMN